GCPLPPRGEPGRGGEPLFACSGQVLRHGGFLLVRFRLHHACQWKLTFRWQVREGWLNLALRIDRWGVTSVTGFRLRNASAGLVRLGAAWARQVRWTLPRS